MSVGGVLLRVLLVLVLTFLLLVLVGGAAGPVEIALFLVVMAAVVFGGPLLVGRLKRT